MRFFDSIVKLNTYIMGIVVLFVAALTGMAIINPDLANPVPVHGSQGVVAGVSTDQTAPKLPTATPTPTPSPTPSPVPVADPVHLSIPSLGIEAGIEHVGVTSENVMEIPHDFFKVGWYKNSPKPGESGAKAAILNGHYDTNNGKPAIFFNLQELEVDDEVIVVASDGLRYVYAVHDIQSHPLTNFPSNIVYGSVQGALLKLITCDGYWQLDTQSYSNRLVVSTHLVRVEKPV